MDSPCPLELEGPYSAQPNTAVSSAAMDSQVQAPLTEVTNTGSKQVACLVTPEKMVSEMYFDLSTWVCFRCPKFYCRVVVTIMWQWKIRSPPVLEYLFRQVKSLHVVFEKSRGKFIAFDCYYL